MLSVLSKLGWFFKLCWKRYTVGVVFLILEGVLEIIPPKLIGMAIDEIHLGTLTKQSLTELLLFYGGLMIVIYVLTYVWRYQIFGGSFLVERILRSRLMEHFLKMTSTFFEKHRTGDLMARATNDLGAISVTAGFGVLTMVDSSVYMSVVILAMGFTISWKLTLAAMLPLPLLAMAISYFGRLIHERFTAAQAVFGEMNDYVLESVSGVRVIRAFVQEEADRERFLNLTDDVYKKNVAVAKIEALFEPANKVLIGLSYMIGLGYGAYLVFHNQITLGELVSFNVYLGLMIWPMFAIGELINVMQRGRASLERVNATLAYQPDVEDADSTVTVGNLDAIVFDRVTFRYPMSAVDNLQDIRLRIRKGETLGIVGRTGSGKTTLLKQLLREYPSGGGKITVSGVPLELISLMELHGWIGYVPQDQMLFSRTVRENILFGNKHATEEQLQKVLELSAFRKDVEHLPAGLDTLVGEKGVSLSGGQKQRISIARALLIDPQILLLDDALSAVDAKTEAQIIGNIRRERAGKTTFIVTHRLSAVEYADWIIVLDDGRIAEEGTHQQLLAGNGWYKEQFERQQIEAQLTEQV